MTHNAAAEAANEGAMRVASNRPATVSAIHWAYATERLIRPETAGR